MKITLIGILPPIRGLSPYCKESLKSLSKDIEVEFIAFKKLYPDFLYLEGTNVKDENYKSEIKNVETRNILTYYNLFSWILAGLMYGEEIIHAWGGDKN